MSDKTVVVNYETVDEVVELSTSMDCDNDASSIIEELTWLVNEECEGMTELKDISVDGVSECPQGVGWAEWVNA